MKSLSCVSVLILQLSLTLPTHAFPKKKSAPPTVQGGNQATTTFTFTKDQFGNNDVINLQAATGQQGGQVKAAKRGILERYPESWELYIRDAYPDPYAEAEPFLNGGGAKGGDSNTKGGNNVKNENTLKNDRFTGTAQTINLVSSTQQTGGNNVGQKGGTNSGSGGQGGSLKIPISLPMPIRRGLYIRNADPEAFHFEERDAYLDAYAEALELHQRDAYPDAYAEAEAEADAEAEIYARDAYFYDESS